MGHRADVLQVAYTPLVDIQTCRQQWESLELLKECNVSEETVSTVDAREILVVHSLFKIQKMVSGTWLVTPHGDHQLAKLTNSVYGPTTLLFTAGSTLPSLTKSKVENRVLSRF